ncbi:cysteine hydrolase family protein [Rhizobium sp. LjRoot30]|uniref:cysteine hydrolase family protein n=1 Tax=Rhizobium sp. LjRoot30 TaxID=3342320 RepID=UPI003ECCA952
MTPFPKTLLQIAGAPLTPSPLDRSALILIDHQLEYVTGALPLSGIEAAIAEAAKLLNLARSHHVPVFHIVHHGRPGAAAFDPQGAYAAIMPELLPADGEEVVIKSLPNSFAGTDLHRLVQETGRKELIIAGFATHMCVSATTRAALDLGYRSTVVAEATASRSLPSCDGSNVIPAETVHQTALAELADRFAVVVPDTAALSSSVA